MKKITILLFLILLGSFASINAMSKPGHRPPRGHGGCVKTPLDGGLLTILGAAGVAYFVARKGRKKES
jgi:hypothetical protein